MDSKRIWVWVMMMGVLGCSSHTSVIVKLGQDTYLHGQGTASLDDNGTFTVQGDGDLQCSGKYDASDGSRLVVLDFSCTDQRYGHVVLVRDPKGTHGAGEGRLSDGTGFSVVMGKVG